LREREKKKKREIVVDKRKMTTIKGEKDIYEQKGGANEERDSEEDECFLETSWEHFRRDLRRSS